MVFMLSQSTLIRFHVSLGHQLPEQMKVCFATQTYSNHSLNLEIVEDVGHWYGLFHRVVITTGGCKQRGINGTAVTMKQIAKL